MAQAVKRYLVMRHAFKAKADLRSFLLRPVGRVTGKKGVLAYPAGVGTERLRKVREQLGRPYDEATAARPETLASVVVQALAFPDDAHLTEISSLRAAPSGARR